MAFTGNVLSTNPLPDIPTLPQPEGDLEWNSMGALGVQDPTYGLQYQLWVGRASRDERSDTKVVLSPQKEGEDITIILPDFPIDQFSFSFDQNMFPAIAYTTCGISKFWWYDTTIQDFRLDTLIDSFSPLVIMDDGRQFNIGDSDIILGYLRINVDETYDLCFKRQRDRYGVEYTLATNVGVKKLKSLGMNEQLRFQFELVDRYGYSGKEPVCKEQA